VSSKEDSLNEMERPMVQLITGVLSFMVVVFLPIEIHAGDPYEAFSVVGM